MFEILYFMLLKAKSTNQKKIVRAVTIYFKCYNKSP